MSGIGHLAIRASAGSGKTFQLARRYIRLLAAGVPPDRIAALTFSRMAAGEIFESIVGALCKAASSEEAARRTSLEIRAGSRLRAADFLGLLRAFLDCLHGSHIGTLDSFIIGVLRAFPAELGIAPEFEVLDGEGSRAAAMRREVLARLYGAGGADDAARRELFEAYKQATFGCEDKAVGERIDSFIASYRRYFQLLPRRDAWGADAAIWPQGCPWLGLRVDAPRLAGEVRARLATDGVDGKLLERWEDFLAAVERFTAGVPWPKPLEYLFVRLMPLLEALSRGGAALRTDRREHRIAPEIARRVLPLLAHLMGAEIAASLEETRGIYRVLELYERLYDHAMRGSGRLTFEDAQYLLTASNACSEGALLSRESGAERRLYLDYRLDCRLDHWLLDEFQDTSDLQWKVLQNLVAEIVQDDGGERSFFCVGDVKQAIYGWRGGNARLFGRILDAYPGRIREEPLSTSFRSCQPVIDVVNAVFGGIEHDGMPAGAVADWNRQWQVHTCAAGQVPEAGYVALLEPPCNDGVKPGEEERLRQVAAILREVDPIARGLSTAVLVRKNETGREVVDTLRRECPGMAVVHEGPAAIADNPVVAALLALVRVAAHPGDRLAWRHVQMSPLGAALRREGQAPAALPLRLLREIQDGGLQAFLRGWGDALKAECPLDAFGMLRLGDLLHAAGEFDRLGERDADAFLEFMETYVRRESGGGRAVRVMTVHQAKGLGFDVVILADLMDARGGLKGGGGVDFVVHREARTDEPLWALVMPRRVVAEHDPVLSTVLEEIRAGDSFDELCVLYVALTRAKRALYLVTGFAGETSTALSAGAFLKERLTGEPNPADGPRVKVGGHECVCLYERGERDWWRGVPLAPAPAPAAPAALPADYARQASRRQLLVPVRPSGEEQFRRPAAHLFRAETRDVLDFGSAIHALLERVEWADGADGEGIIREWLREARGTAEVRRDASEQFRRLLASDGARSALARPAGPAELWREKSFELVLDGRLVTGAFDRVVIEKDGAGRPRRARILDYKSDRKVDEASLRRAAEGYAPQLALYARALSRILNLDPAAIATQILFTRAGAVVDTAAPPPAAERPRRKK